MIDEKARPPFSARNRGAHVQIESDFPEPARMGLLHLLHQCVDRNYVEDWLGISIELQRIARLRPDRDRAKAREIVEEILLQLPWEKVFDFCERLHAHLAREVSHYDGNLEDWILDAPLSEVQKYIGSELQLLFIEENLAFEFSDGLVRRRGRRHTADQVARAELVLGDPRLSAARIHYNKALRYFRNVTPDPENTVKEAVCAVEATARALFPRGGATLGAIIKYITGSNPGQLPKPIAQTFQGLYGFRSGGDGVSHGGAAGGAATKELAEYSLAVAASQIVLLVDLAMALEPDIPF
jgi:hypothetical protein